MRKPVPARHSRRATLRWLLTTGIGLLTPLSALALNRRDKTNGSTLPAYLDAILTNSYEASRLGTHYLHENPVEADLAFLCHCVCDMTHQSRLQACIRREFDTGMVVTVDGWLLSRTEARLYALSALLRQPAA